MSEKVNAKKDNTSELTAQEKRELSNIFGGMSMAEMEYIVGLIPVELCVRRIEKELHRAKELENKIKNVIANFD